MENYTQTSFHRAIPTKVGKIQYEKRKKKKEKRNKYVTFFMTYFPMLFQEKPSNIFIFIYNEKFIFFLLGMKGKIK
jgi:hypothetical protein